MRGWITEGSNTDWEVWSYQNRRSPDHVFKEQKDRQDKWIRSMIRLFPLFLFLCFVGNAETLFAVDLLIQDARRTEITVRGAQIDYTKIPTAPGIYTIHRDNVPGGILAYQAEGKVEIEWQKIQQVAITPDRSSDSDRVGSYIVFVDGRTQTLNLVAPGKVFGDVDWGQFEIDIKRIKTIVPLKEKLAGKFSGWTPYQHNIRLTDIRGNVVELKEAQSRLKRGNEFGLFADLGEGQVRIEWAYIDSVTMKEPKDGFGKPSFEFFFVNGESATLNITEDSFLTGESSLGRYEIKFEQVKTILPLRDEQWHQWWKSVKGKMNGLQR